MLQQSTSVIGHHIVPQTRALKPEHIEHRASKIGLPRLDVLPDSAAPQPQASLLPQPQGISSFSLFSLLHIRVNRLMGMGFSLRLSVPLSLYLKTESNLSK